MKLAIAQIDATVGDLEGNEALIKRNIGKAKKLGADLVVFPELAITGYPPQDLLLYNGFVQKNLDALEALKRATKGIAALVGFVDKGKEGLYNSAALLQDTHLLGKAHKTLLPTYDVFDEARYFQAGSTVKPLNLRLNRGVVKLGVEICEDLWDEAYRTKVSDLLVRGGAELVINISASPFHVGKRQERLKLLQSKARRLHVPVVYANAVGGQDELIFDGESMAVDVEGKLIGLAKQFEEDLLLLELDRHNRQVSVPRRSKEEEIFRALVLGLRDYCRKTGFKRVVLGLSGGIDSSLVACITAEALGPENVLGVAMPSRYSSPDSMRDAETLAENLGIRFQTISIEAVFKAYEGSLTPQFKRLAPDVTEENIQARTRGNILMALSNKFGYLVITTGNKTELALGYCTLYGDMSGGLAVIGDVSKTEVYALARCYNKTNGRKVIPESCFTKVPSAELRPNQRDPFDYDVVSPLVEEIIENRRSRSELLKMGYSKSLVEDVLGRIRAAEYKRVQAPPTLKVTRKAFGIGWKMPVANKYAG